ncbi:MAG TPA: DMT family transporter [Hyphomicrobiaceae bacterium]|nr:DMT family transporter [Hyphomicrobiaceae bacterium]
MPQIRLRLRSQPSTGNDPVAGVIWITLAMALFAGLAMFSRMAMNAGLHPFEVVFLRNTFACLMLLPLLLYRGPRLFYSDQFNLYGLRVVISLLSMQTWFYAIFLIPIGEVTAISFLAPLFGTLGAVFLLGEVVRIRRWTALGVGFLGALVILRPVGSEIGLGQVLAIFSAMAAGLTVVLVKQLTAHDDPDKIVFLTNVLMTPLSLVPALFVWSWPTMAVLPALVGMGVCAVLGHICVVRGYAATDASLGMTFEFSKLPFTVAMTYLAFRESIDLWTWVGALIIFASALYITRREAKLARERAQKMQAREATGLGG